MKQPTIKSAPIAFLFYLSVLPIALFGPYSQSPAQAQEPANASAAPAPASARNAAVKLTVDRDATGALTLSDLRDAGLSLNQLRQQAKNIFQEATRKPCDNSSKFEILFRKTISDKDIETNSKTSVYLEPRVQWLVFYVGTIEPIVGLFAQDVSDTKSGAAQLLVPEDTKDKILPLWHEWADGIDGINKELTDINNLIGTPKQNVSLAKHAVAIFKYTQNLERTRKKAFAAIRSSQKRKTDENKVSIQ